MQTATIITTIDLPEHGEALRIDPAQGKVFYVPGDSDRAFAELYYPGATTEESITWIQYQLSGLNAALIGTAIHATIAAKRALSK
jgi:hypothetical protein